MSFLAFLVAATISATGVFGSVPISVKEIAAVTVPKLEFDCAEDCLLNKVIERSSKLPLQERLKLINSTVNQAIRYSTDEVIYERRDYWALPDEIAAKRAGDCEDFAILKMAALLKAGVPQQKMSIVVVQDVKRNLTHAVLSVSTDKGAMILDNLHKDVRLDKTIHHYEPLFSVNGTGSWLHGKKIKTPIQQAPNTQNLCSAKTLAMISPQSERRHVPYRRRR